MNINCKSTVNGMSDTVTQIIHFVGGVKRTYHGILSDSIKQGQMTKFPDTTSDYDLYADD